ncbi:MAG: nucleoside triphosphate pyrophosphohydrolase [Nitrosospira sp.]|nr:nucleoside triphosphate pyrophosphohydrolase [Nitrosospira sp.]
MTLPATERLLEIMRTLRDPSQGCPWDRRQDFASIVPHTLEEAYELAEAIETGNVEDLRAELGDLLFQIVFYSQLGNERGWFDFEAVAKTMCAKLERRPPHVFSGSAATTVAEASNQWERIKVDERGGKSGVLQGVALNLPALSRAQKLQKRAASVGFDWDDPAPVSAKVIEELAEFHAELEHAEPDPGRLEEELGDLLFACVNLARHAGVDAETAARRANRKFESRFAYIEQQLVERGKTAADSSLEEMDALWDEAKGEVDRE